jgi:PAS domain S-box-containing protein
MLLEDQTDRQFSASGDRLRHLYEATPAMLYSIDSNGKLLMVSDALLDKLGFSREEVVGRAATDFMTPASREYALTVMLPAFFRTGRCDNVECQMIAKDGRIIDVLMSAAFKFDEYLQSHVSMAAIIDITSQKASEQKLIESEARYRTLADNSSDMVFQLDQNLACCYASPACREILGYECEEVIGVKPVETAHREDAVWLAHIFQTLMSGEEDRQSIINRARRRDGQWIWAEIRLRSLRDPETGRPIGIIGALRDISARQRAAQELEQAKTAAESAARVKSEFVANMSHELRTPLTGILGIHDLLRADGELLPRHRRYLDMAYDAGQSLMTIVNDVLDFSKIEAGQLTIEAIPFDLRSVIEACQDLANEEARKKSLTIDIRIVSEPAKLIGDPNRLRQIILNLVTNAVKFTHQGHVLIEAQYRSDVSQLRIVVSDTGVGIPPDKLPTIFDRFSQADGSITRRYGGTGLGLAICKRLVELMGGWIAVDSTLGRGSTFWLELPIREVQERDVTVLDSRPRTVGPRRRILLAEDNLVNRMVITEMLQQRGDDVLAVEDGAAALSGLISDASVDVVLMDVQMPVMDGLSATRAIRSAESAKGRSASAIIGLTANARSDDKAACLAAGMDAHVAKPVDWADLFSTIERVIENKTKPSNTVKETPMPILDTTSLERLASIMGRERVARLLNAFILDVSRRNKELKDMTATELSAHVHSCKSMAGQLGFIELSRLCATVEEESTTGGDHRVSELLAAGERAVDAAQSCSYASAA